MCIRDRPEIDEPATPSAESKDEDSPWKKRFGTDFKGMVLPFGCGVWFMPAPTICENSQAAPRLSYGIFLGYRNQPGGRWNGEYLVADIDHFAGKDLDVDSVQTEYRFWPHITKVVRLPNEGVTFPLKERYDWYNNTLDGRETHLLHMDDLETSLGEAKKQEGDGPEILRPSEEPPPIPSSSSKEERADTHIHTGTGMTPSIEATSSTSSARGSHGPRDPSLFRRPSGTSGARPKSRN